MPSSLTLPASGTLRNGRLYPRPRWARRTSASDCSSSESARPTPRASEGASHAPGTGGKSLTTESALWPTPNVPNGGRTLSPEAVAAKGATDKGKRGDGGMDLRTATALWQTPRTALCSIYAERDETLAARGRDGRDTLPRPAAAAMEKWATPRAIYGEHPGMADPTHLTGQAISLSFPLDPPTEPAGPPSSAPDPSLRRQLSVPFVEWIQGFPIGFTALKPLAMPSYLLRQRRHLWNCGSD